MNAASLSDTAPVGGTPTPRLRRTDEEQPGNEMPSAVLFGKTGLYFVATVDMGGTAPQSEGGTGRANRRIQGGMIPFTLVNEAGTINAVPDKAAAKYITNNNGNEYRQFNNSTAQKVTIGGQEYALVQYNYQPQGTNDTKRYLQLFKPDGTNVLPQTEFIAKNNDDCSMHQDGDNSQILQKSANSISLFTYNGCNGNGRDDGWVFRTDITVDAAGQASIQKVWNVSVCPREERSRGTVRLVEGGKGLAVTWTEGNNQPQRDGVWMAMLDLEKNAQGNDQQQLISWKEQIDGRVDQDGIRTYSMRIKMEQLPAADGTASDKLLLQYGHLRGNNNTNGKGGTYYRSMTGIVTATRAGLQYSAPMADINRTALLGIDNTHVGTTFGMFGTEGKAVPGIVYISGNHFGGSTKSSLRVVTFGDSTITGLAGTVSAAGTGAGTGGGAANAGTLAGAPFDRHLYPNYLGNNPGNQGRNHSQGQIIANPFLAEGHDATQLLVYATTAKDTGDAGGATTNQLMSPEIKLAAWLTVVPVQAKAAVEPPVNPEEPTVDPETPPADETEDPGAAGSSLGGCSTGNSTGGIMGLLLLGLAFIRRRR
jgi:MYXO-CTERM domain-containing protein